MQGDFEFVEDSGKVRTEGFENLVLGNIKKAKFGSDMYEVNFGNHVMKGKAQQLAKPLLFTERLEEKNDQGEVTSIKYEIRGTIYDKIVFSTRPTPLKVIPKDNAVNLRRKLPGEIN